LNFTSSARDSKLFRNISSTLFEALRTQNLTSNEHHSGVLPTTFLSNDLLFKTFDVLSTNVDPKTGKEFVSTIESKLRPYTGTQWHPEKSNFEWSTTVDLPHSAHAVEVSQYVGVSESWEYHSFYLWFDITEHQHTGTSQTISSHVRACRLIIFILRRSSLRRWFTTT